MAKKFSELRTKMSSESQARAVARAEAMLVEMQLQELRKVKQVEAGFSCRSGRIC